MATSYYIHSLRNVSKRLPGAPKVQCWWKDSLIAELAPGCLDGLADYDLGDVKDEDVAVYRENPSQDGYSFEQFCERLLLILIEGRELEPARDVGAWCDEIAEIVERRGGWHDDEGRGPFFEMFRDLYRGRPMDDDVCRKLVADFDRWEAHAQSIGNRKFYDYYQMLRECFRFASSNGVVIFPYE
ncbi:MULTISPECIES: hypothetical protein [Pandoraea]|uniref:Uncharacterized protein n=2 Tax=Pandoraea TaxID=93217 RepID=A0A5E4S9G9_9BURK|nr:MULTISPECIES: hypothetical protein [Pandoraea]AJF00201.1 hypothetical protein SG18_22145 [Pandoraea apista]AKH74363.1 hypothetical protein XM39_22325 [Pandoraea apista]AKI62913.1 hypothetical protein AA956_15650 [Pandoraea apista]VVD62305.1 hypothetical protein PPN31114_00163 [Pandoraea pneumonica]VVD72506.1 hypothetical protein PAQ31011_00683 [Pandoraea aquatica]